MKSIEAFIIKSAVVLLVGVIALCISLSISAQQATEELPKALGTYLSAMEGLIEWQETLLGHAWATKQYTFYTYGYKGDRIYPTLKKWAAPEIKNVSGQNLSIIIYFTLGAIDPEKFKLYHLRTRKDVKPLITTLEEIKLSAVPIMDIPGLVGNMVRLVPDRVLTKGNYLFLEGDIDSKLLFSIESKSKMFFRTDSKFEDCLKILNSSRIIEEDLQKEFENNGISVSNDATITVIQKGNKWRITDIDKKKTYLIKKEKERLDIYDSEKRCWGFTVDGGDELWRNPPLWEKCIACLCLNKGYGPIE